MATPDIYSRNFYGYKTNPSFSPRAVVSLNPEGMAGREARKIAVATDGDSAGDIAGLSIVCLIVIFEFIFLHVFLLL